MSVFPVTISDIGFGRTTEMRATLALSDLSSGKRWPVRLESRESVTAYAGLGKKIDPKVVRRPIAYAETDCGVIQYGTSPIFTDYMKKMKRNEKWGQPAN
jgi:hypothetical protein